MSFRDTLADTVNNRTGAGDGSCDDTPIVAIHLFIVVGLVSSLLGIFGLYKWRRTRERRWLRMHQMRFSFSYAGLLMAGVSQVATNPRFGIVTQLTPATFWASFVLTNVLILSIAMVMVHRYIAVGDPLRRYAMRPDA